MESTICSRFNAAVGVGAGGSGAGAFGAEVVGAGAGVGVGAPPVVTGSGGALDEAEGAAVKACGAVLPTAPARITVRALDFLDFGECFSSISCFY